MHITLSLKTMIAAGAASAAAVVLSACGAWQSAHDTTTEAARAVFVAKVKQMNVDIASRAALNPGEEGKPLPVVLRVYQLRNAKVFETATYTQLLDEDRDRLKADLLWFKETTLAPDATMTLSEP